MAGSPKELKEPDNVEERPEEGSVESGSYYETEAYAKWYAQYVQYWQHSYTQQNLQQQQQQNDPLYDSEYHQFVQMHGASNVATPGSLYEGRRSNNMLNHYFDAQQQYASAVQPTAVAADAQQGQAATKKKAPTKEELEYWRKRKEETKKIRNRWLYQ